LRMGQEFFLSAPSGGPPWSLVQGAAHLILIGMGTGIAPLRALSQARLDRATAPGSLTLIQGARTLGDCLFYDELSALGSAQLDYRPVLSQPEPSWSGRRGYVQEHLADLPLGDAYVCICGKLAMVEEVTARLGKLGVDGARIFSEGY